MPRAGMPGVSVEVPGRLRRSPWRDREVQVEGGSPSTPLIAHPQDETFVRMGQRDAKTAATRHTGRSPQRARHSVSVAPAVSVARMTHINA